MPNKRVVHRRRHAYSTRSNKIKKVRTPGNKLLVQYRGKRVGAQKCGDCKGELIGIPHYTASERARLPNRALTVRRAHGGHLCGTCCRERIIRAFLIEEQKIVKHMFVKGKAAKKEGDMAVEEPKDESKKQKKEPRKPLGRKPEAGEKKKGEKGKKGEEKKGIVKKSTEPKKATAPKTGEKKAAPTGAKPEGKKVEKKPTTAKAGKATEKKGAK